MNLEKVQMLFLGEAFMKIIDISWPISRAMTQYKNKEYVSLEHIKSYAEDGVRETLIHMAAHTGTHIDAPSHFMRDGKTIDQLDLHMFFGPSVVVDCTAVGQAITAEFLQKESIKENDIVLLKTVNSAFGDNDSFNPYFTGLDVSGALYLIEKKIKAVGIDYFSIERTQDSRHLVHHELFKNNVGIIEGLRLLHVDAGSYLFCGFPLKMVGIDAAPARVVLIKE